MKKFKFFGMFFAILYCSTLSLNAQDKEAKIKLIFEKGDSINVCKVQVTSNDSAVAEVGVHLYVKRMFSLLPVGGSETTDDDGMVSFEFPNDIPADQNGKLIIIAKIEDDDNYANTETSGEIDWGVLRKADTQKMQRSLSAAGDRAPIYFIVISSLIVLGIWGTLIYVILQIFKIKKLSTNK